MQIKKIMLRYYVPFSFVCTSIDQYHDICESCGNLFGVATVPITSEDDFFDNIGDLYELNSSAAIGTFFSASNIELPKLISQDKNFSVEIKKAGLYLNKNGVGIFWYEVLPCKEILRDSDLLIRFQNSFKELARNKSKFQWKLHKIEKKHLEHQHNENIVIKDKDEISDFIMHYAPEYADFELSKIVCKKGENTILLIENNLDFQLGMWVHNVLEFLPEIRFMPQRIKKESGINIPDKAIICSCVAFESTSNTDTLDFIFSLTHGYTTSYQRIEGLENELYTPFKNIKWYAAQEGMGQYIVLSDETKESFFYDLAFNRMTNYCYLFALVLQQYYSLLTYSKRISTLPDDNRIITKETYNRIVGLVDDLNNFFLRNTFPQISHISHQNGVYQYLRQVYNITDFYAQVNDGIQAVSERAELYKAEKHDDHVKMFAIIGTILGASEVLSNTSDIISFILNKDSADIQWLTALLGSIGGSVILGFSIWCIWFSNKYKRKR